jgi:purine-binding chemotaxis protein CheW
VSASPEKTHLALVIGIGGRRCAIPLSGVAEVLRPLPIDPLPSPIEAVLGVTVLRGAAVPVIDPALLLEGEVSRPGRFVVLRLGARRAILAVAEIHGVQDLAGLPLEALPPLLRDAASEAIENVSRLDRELLLVLNAARLVQAPLSQASEAGA